ncbi:glycosyltransferase family 9 protein [Roseivirga echinicomitans]
MRTNKKYSFKEAVAILSQFLISKFSLWYFKNISSKKITLIRKQGIGDAIFATGLVEQFSNTYPNTTINLVANIPEVFKQKSKPTFSITDFPLVWMMYEQNDFSFLRKEDQHITKVIATHLGLDPNLNFSYSLPEVSSVDDSFIARYITGKNYIIIQPWAGKWNSDRNWTAEKWEMLVGQLNSKGHLVYQIGTKEEIGIKGALDLRGKATLSESFILIKHAAFFIGVNSFGEQAAACHNVPSVILYGPTHPIYSLNENQAAVFPGGTAMVKDLPTFIYKFEDTSLIEVASVLSKVEDLMSSHIDSELFPVK